METKPVFIRRPYDGMRLAVKKEITQPSMTKQADKAACDVNAIMAKYHKTGVITSINRRQPRYDDVSNATNYHDAINIVLEAEEAFAGLSAKVRKAFDNDPGQLLAALDDPEQHDMLRELGILQEGQQVPEASLPGSDDPNTGRKGPKQRSEARSGVNAPPGTRKGAPEPQSGSEDPE